MPREKPNNGRCCNDNNLFDNDLCPNSDVIYGFCTSERDVCVLYEKHLLKIGTASDFIQMWRSKSEMKQSKKETGGRVEGEFEGSP